MKKLGNVVNFLKAQSEENRDGQMVTLADFFTEVVLGVADAAKRESIPAHLFMGHEFETTADVADQLTEISAGKSYAAALDGQEFPLEAALLTECDEWARRLELPVRSVHHVSFNPGEFEQCMELKF